MQLTLSNEEAGVLRHALEVYLSDLRAEIVKTERHEWKVDLHKEEEVLQGVIARLD